MCFWNSADDVCNGYGVDDPILFKDATFIVRDPLQKSKTLELVDCHSISFSLESVNCPQHFLKYFEGNVIIQKLKSTNEDNTSATWIFDNCLSDFISSKKLRNV